ncbi:MAG: EfeM/EfeO family lipoprotein [Bacillaceae bacterium]|jgi:iron uptake system component EfeO|uniref:Iron ABC transporter substrate-binding protein n=2 Tax=Aeribacillus TaxID=1055323 RepID=A0A165YDM0_9BACI|nr:MULTISPECIES: iron uptake system protein EfeO [Aeribacillus]REJ13736.1 MAG: EfeM/EfeO family lipoprotein [Bacillaceae bacterium]KZN96965.1 iron ABC transporter substrate-binding protein [Aeribacillus pallidus]MED0716847.1 EfeM/EfeO family lipoprotein [Aeribacillus composti]MED0746383.1 EfeM/EfeO family lipoprotein [Aeribacillus composti]MED1441118.1 EfeM/EfeO family lipoprotein [Aeribacillus composti]
MKRYKLPVILFLSSSLLFSCSQSNESSTTEPAKKETAKESSQVDLNQISTDYRTFAIAEIDEFVKKTEEFANAVIAGDVEKAKELYAPARMHYERSEPIAEAFAELDPKIDAREGDVPDAEWGGYHRIEKGLWVENTTKGYEKYAEQLIKDVKLLRAKVETVDVTPDLLITGAVDLLNEVSTSKVTGEEDRYSHTDLYDFVANVEGAEKIYELMSPALKEKDEALAKEIEQRFQAVYALLDKYKKGDGYISYTELTKDQVKELSQSINELAEPLSKLGVVLEG